MNQYLIRGLLVDLLLVIAVPLLFFIVASLEFRGNCLDVLAVDMARPCTYREFLTRDMPLIFLLMVLEYWWLILIALLLPLIGGYAKDRRRLP